MSENASTRGDESQPSPGAGQAVAVLSQFRAALLAGKTPRIEDFLPGSTAKDHPGLLSGLVTLEVAYRLRHGEKPTADAYRARFPGLNEAIDQAFNHPALKSDLAASGPAPHQPPATPPSADEGAANQGPLLDLAAAPYALAADLGVDASVRRL